MSLWVLLQRCLTGKVRGNPRWRAHYMTEGLGRVKWVSATGILLLLVQARALDSSSALRYFVDAAAEIGCSPQTLVYASVSVGIVGALVLLASTIQPLSIKAAQRIIAFSAFTALTSQALLFGFAHLNKERIASLDVTLVIVLATAPLGPVISTAIFAAALGVMVIVAYGTGNPSPPDLIFVIHPITVLIFGIVINRWHFMSYKAHYLSRLRVVRRGEELRRREQRIAQLANDLEAANLAKTRFLATASHDLRQPMHAIGILVAALRRYISAPEAREIVARIEASVEAMDSLFITLLDISKLDAGIVAPQIATFPIQPLLAEALLHYAPQAQQKGLTLRVVKSSALVRSDPALLRSIVTNLVGNALRYTNRGIVLLGCRLRGAKLEIQVWDTGIGIAEDDSETIFEEFTQLSNPNRDRGAGVGLGLAIVRRLSALLDHSVSLRSELGKGSMFAVAVPLIAMRKLTSLELRPPDLPSGVLAGAFVVVIEDEAEIRFGMEALLGKLGCHVVCAGSGQEAAAALREHQRTPDLIVSDYRLGLGETAIQAIETVRAELGEKIPALIVTGSALTDEVARVATIGYTVLLKPVTEKLLCAKMAELLVNPGERAA